MAKQVKKKVKIKVLPFVIALIVCVLVYFCYSFLVSLPIKNIYISGNSILTDQEIIELAELRNYPSFAKLSASNLSKKIKSNDYVNNVKINKKFYNQVYIDIDEARALFINDSNELVLSNGKSVQNDKQINVPILINYTPDSKYEMLIEKLNKVNNNIFVKISEIKYDPTEQDKDRFGLYMDDGNLVYLTLTKFEMIDYYDSVLNEIGCKKGILNLDSGNHFETKIECSE